MDVKEELQLFSRYTNIFKGDSTAVMGIASVHLAQQLERYINPSLDLGWVIRCILDINSDNLFSNSRKNIEELTEVNDITGHPEYNYANFIIKLCTLFIAVEQSKELTEEEASHYILTKQSEFYFGEELSKLNSGLLELACPDFNTVK